MNFTVLDQYNSFVENHFINEDSQQIDALKKIYNAWSNNKHNNYFFKQKKIKGVYVYGPVGTGKTFLLNLFYQNTKVGKKIHFNHLMNDVHNTINTNQGRDEKIEDYVRQLSKKINQSIKFLLSEYKRLKKKNDEGTISKEEKETFLKLASFLGKQE